MIIKYSGGKYSRQLTWLHKGVLILAPLLVLLGCNPHPDNTTNPASTGTTNSPAPGSIAASKILSVQPVAQETQEWCWAASAQMIFQYYGMPILNGAGDYQCGIVAAYFGQYYPICYANCYACVQGIPSMDQEQLLINGYGQLANYFGRPSRVLNSRLLFSALTLDLVVAEINNGRPILAGISPSGYRFPDVSEHAVVVVGYNVNGASERLIINDPFPYDIVFPQSANPYLLAGGVEQRPGQYAVPYSSFVALLNWGNTLYGIQ